MADQFRSVLRYLMAGHGEPLDLADIDLTALRRNVVVVRMHASLGAQAPQFLRDAALDQQAFVDSTLDAVSMISRELDAAGIAHVFPKAFQHLPDMGHDIDLLADAPPGDIARVLTGRMGAAPGRSSVMNRFAGKTAWELPGVRAPLEVHHGTMGQVGEHRGLAELVIRSRVRREGPRGTVFEARPEHQIVIQAVQRVCGHATLRASDVLSAVRLLGGKLDLAELRRAVDAAGAHRAFRTYLRAIAQIHEEACGVPAPFVHDSEWASGPPVRLGRRKDVARFGVALVVAPAYASKLASDAGNSRWDPAIRVAALPLMAGIALGELGVRRLRRG